MKSIFVKLEAKLGAFDRNESVTKILSSRLKRKGVIHRQKQQNEERLKSIKSQDKFRKSKIS